MAELNLTYDALKMELRIYPIESSRTHNITEVVRCKDCKYKRHNKHHDVILCDHDIGVRGLLKPDDFCSYGERREGE